MSAYTSVDSTKTPQIQTLPSESAAWDFIACLAFSFIGLLSASELLPSPILGISLMLLAAGSLWVFGIFNKTLLNVKGVFTFVYFGAIGLSLLHLHSKQVTWSVETWVVLITGYLGFILGSSIKTKPGAKRHVVDSDVAGDYLVALGVVITGAFLVDCVYSGGVPILAGEMASYMSFGMPLVHYVTVSGCLYPGLAYASLKTQELPKKQAAYIKILAVLIMTFPILSVSRDQLLDEVVVLGVAWFIFGWREKRVKPIYILALGVISLIAWLVMSQFRNQDYAYIAAVFKLENVTNNVESALWQLYLYIGFNFDNLNYLINNLNEFAHGYCSLGGILAIFNLEDVLFDSSLGSTASYRILSTYNTYSILRTPFQDFGIWFVGPYMALIGYFSSFVEAKARATASPVWIAIYGYVIYALAISFFANKFSQTLFIADLLILGTYNILTTVGARGRMARARAMRADNVV